MVHKPLGCRIKKVKDVDVVGASATIGISRYDIPVTIEIGIHKMQALIERVGDFSTDTGNNLHGLFPFFVDDLNGIQRSAGSSIPVFVSIVWIDTCYFKTETGKFCEVSFPLPPVQI